MGISDPKINLRRKISFAQAAALKSFLRGLKTHFKLEKNLRTAQGSGFNLMILIYSRDKKGGALCFYPRGLKSALSTQNLEI